MNTFGVNFISYIIAPLACLMRVAIIKITSIDDSNDTSKILICEHCKI